MTRLKNPQILLAVIALLVMVSAINGQIPYLINYQGQLTDDTGNPVPNDQYSIQFTVYDNSETILWRETHASVTTSGGLFDVLLGAGDHSGYGDLDESIFSDSIRWLGIKVGENPEFTPRTRLVSVPYAHQAKSTTFSDSTDAITDGAVDMADIEQAGAISGQVLKWNGSAWSPAEADAGTSGWTDDGSVVRLDLESDSVGIGTTTPAAKLDVVGDMVLSGKATMGPSNTNTGDNSFVFGKSNNASGDNATISGGWMNTASGQFQSTVSGGAANTSSHTAATVGGGQSNTASGLYSTIGGGFSNTADGNSPTVSGGYQNAANGDYSFTTGYADTISASGDYSVLFGIGSKLTQDSTFMVDMPHVRIGDETDGFELPTIDGTSGQVMTTNGSGQLSWTTPEAGGGESKWTESGGVLFTTGVYGIARLSNTIWGINNDSTHINLGIQSTTGEFGFDHKYITISGGYQNIASSEMATIGGGASNSAGDSATIGGGYNNTASGNLATVGGGSANLANGVRATIGGGSNNHAAGDLPTVGGGYSNYAVDSAAVGGGVNNDATGASSTIGGGSLNKASGNYATVGGGLIDTASGDYATVAGGWNNMASNNYATVGGGQFNNASGESSTIAGGMDNEASCTFGTISGGGSNTLGTTASATIGGGYNNDALGNGSTVGGGIANAALDEYTTVGGGWDNAADSGYSTVCGGNNNLAVGNFAAIVGGSQNVSGGDGAFIGGGYNNSTGGPYPESGDYAFIGGGQQNDVPGRNSVVCGGSSNTASSSASTVCGGSGNTASLTGAIVCGGRSNTASGLDAIVCGGSNNTAEAANTFAAGNRAHAVHLGSFVWSDNSGASLSSSGTNQFVVRAEGGFRFYSNDIMTSGVTLDPGGGSWVSVSDSTLKENIQPVDGDEILEKLAELKVSRWNYKSQDASIEHIGPMAQDFYRLFGLGNNNTSISTIDPDGISLAAIKALIEKNNDLEAQNSELNNRLAKLEMLVEQLIGK